jgi:hypothetical protein
MIIACQGDPEPKPSYPKPNSWIEGMSRAWEDKILGCITLNAGHCHECQEYWMRLDKYKADPKTLYLEILYRD